MKKIVLTLVVLFSPVLPVVSGQSSSAHKTVTKDTLEMQMPTATAPAPAAQDQTPAAQNVATVAGQTVAAQPPHKTQIHKAQRSPPPGKIRLRPLRILRRQPCSLRGPLLHSNSQRLPRSLLKLPPGKISKRRPRSLPRLRPTRRRRRRQPWSPRLPARRMPRPRRQMMQSRNLQLLKKLWQPLKSRQICWVASLVRLSSTSISR